MENWERQGEEMVETDHDKVKRRKRILRKEREDRDGESREVGRGNG